MKKLLSLLLILFCFTLSGCAYSHQAEFEIASQLILLHPESEKLEVTEVLCYDADRATYYISLSDGSVLQLAPGRITPAIRCRGSSIHCSLKRINRELQHSPG